MPDIINKRLASIPIKVAGVVPNKRQPGYHGKRRIFQTVVLLLVILVPLSGLFRIDPEVGGLVVLDRQIWFSDFFLISGLWIMLASGLVLLYSVAGTVFCGWACPQNTLAEWANHMTHKLLGKRAEISLVGEAPQVAIAKNKILNWTLLGLSFLAVSMLFALIPLLYFYPPDVVWSFIIWRPDTRLAGSLYWIYTVWVMIILLDISVVRHFWCRFACVYRVWQHSFKTRETLHVSYDASRVAECSKCNYCVTTCFIDLDPRKTESFDSCINCGDCIDACNTLQGRKGEIGLLSFATRARDKTRKFRDNSMSLFSRLGWTAPFAILGAVMFAWGIWTYQPYHLSMGNLETPDHQLSAQDYRIEVTSKQYKPSELAVSVLGLAPTEYKLSNQQVKLDSVGRASITLSISTHMPQGIHPFVVEVHSRDGWAGRFTANHFAG